MLIRRKLVGGVLAAVAASGLVFATGAPAVADEVRPHRHCLWTPAGWQPIAVGVSEYAPNDPALVNFHYEVHLGEPGSDNEPLIIRPIFQADLDCEDLQAPVVG